MTADKSFLPYGKHTVDEDDIRAVTDVLRGNWLTTGPMVANFERAFASKVGADYAVACSNGTTALHLCALALGLGPGDAAVVPSLTFLATANCVRYTGAEVIFADVDPATGLMTAGSLRDALKRAGDLSVKAVLPVHLNGQCADMAEIADVAAMHGLKVVEDACHALGAYYGGGMDGVPVGSCRYGDLTVFSLHPVKTITTGEGGMIAANDPTLYERLIRLRSHGMVRTPEHFQNHDLALSSNGSPNPWYYEMPELGFNYRLSDINCALGQSQLQKLERFIAARQALSQHYDHCLSPLAPYLRPISRMPGCRPGWHLYVVHIDFDAIGQSRAEVMNRLNAQGIGSQVHYLPVHMQPYYQALYGQTHLPGAEEYYRQCLSLPLYPDMTTSDVERVAEALTTILSGRT